MDSEIVEILESLVLCKHCQKYPAHAQATWTAIIGLALLLEAEGLRRHRNHTLSHVTRQLFKTDKKPGKALFVGGWTALTWWFVGHILRGSK